MGALALMLWLAAAPDGGQVKLSPTQWVKQALAAVSKDGDFDAFLAAQGSAPRANGSFVERTPADERFATLLSLEQQEKVGRTRRVTVTLKPAAHFSRAALEKAFGAARAAPPMADRDGRHVTWTSIITPGDGSARVVLRLEGQHSDEVLELTVDDFVPAPPAAKP